MNKSKHILIKNIYYMLSYAFSALRQPEYKYLSTEPFENIHDLFASILAKGISKQIKHGLYREYMDCTEDMSVLRGKISMRDTINHRISQKPIITCQFDELSENNLLNQVLKTVSLLLMRHTEVKAEYKYVLKKELFFFSKVDTVDLLQINWSLIRFVRNNQTYRLLIGICRMIIEGMLLTESEGKYKLASFLDEQRMYRLYEKFIFHYYDQEFPTLNVSASSIDWVLNDRLGPMLPEMRSDITLKRGKTILIIDAKYYSRIHQSYYDVQRIRSSHLYQIFTYVKNKDAAFKSDPHQVAGMLLYARTDEAIQPDYSYLMSGNRISVNTLDLNREFSEIVQQLNQIVADHFDHEHILAKAR